MSLVARPAPARHHERMDDGAEAVRRVARVFDELAEDYDQSGVSFFGPIAQGLVELLDPRPGEHVVDVGCGRGALTFAAARAVGPEGRVTAVDIAPAMVEHTRRAAAAGGLSQVATAIAADGVLDLPERTADVVASSLVLFFAPDPVGTLRTWIDLLTPGGRIGISTFGEADPTWKRIDQLFRPYLPPAMLDPRTTGEVGSFTSDEGVEQMFSAVGAVDLRSVRRPLDVHFPDAATWRRFSMSTGQRAMWRFVPEERRESLYAEAAEILEDARTASGDIVLVQDVRYTLGQRPA